MLLEQEQIIHEIQNQVNSKPAVAVAYLMGSYADGTATHLSDVDVGIGVYPSLCPDTDTAMELAEGLEYRLIQALFPAYDPDPWTEWLFYPVEVVVLNASHTRPSLPWMLAAALPVYTPDASFRAELEELAFRKGRPTPEEARIAAWRLKAAWIVRAARGQVYAPYERLLRTCLNLAHRAVVRLGLPVPPERRQLPLVLAEAGVVSWRAVSFLIEAIEILSHRDMDMKKWKNLHSGMRLLADYAFQVEDALERNC
ncbi:nucleotidyltransferase domain-containing protein [Calderihabitans maritimus]|uniref:DNA polymerase beta domain-containing protein n=1 Tax=Calderihabitans maritimus TaxID=1246530 RepID=A0A1Z5HQW6_9FIRM|nr:nucleotidyltransferase domain-containing protein [Calderihabitans maritimus]GAW91711.1 DNA polymerase beta domain-containing protein [Calderihabitans maritimus]